MLVVDFFRYCMSGTSSNSAGCRLPVSSASPFDPYPFAVLPTVASPLRLSSTVGAFPNNHYGPDGDRLHHYGASTATSARERDLRGKDTTRYEFDIFTSI
jgi:hypothetical protein